MTDAVVVDLRRELEKAQVALIAAQKHLVAHAEMNAALHCADRVMYSPLHAKVEHAVQDIDFALDRTKPANLPTLDSRSSDGAWAAVLADLDRCMHGRHEGDACAGCGGTSRGNHRLRPGDFLGYDGRGGYLVMPDHEHKHNPGAWRTKTAPAAQPDPGSST